jgi:hypothetical protein
VKTFKVGTFYDGRRFSAYTTWYSPEWTGCVEYEIKAVNGTHAKNLAIQKRKKFEMEKLKDAPATPLERST